MLSLDFVNGTGGCGRRGRWHEPTDDQPSPERSIDLSTLSQRVVPSLLNGYIQRLRPANAIQLENQRHGVAGGDVRYNNIELVQTNCGWSQP